MAVRLKCGDHNKIIGDHKTFKWRRALVQGVRGEEVKVFLGDNGRVVVVAIKDVRLLRLVCACVCL